MARYIASLSRPGLAACVVLTLLAVGLLGPGESEFVEFSDPAVRPPAAAGSDPSVTVVTVDPTSSTSTTSIVGPPPAASPVATVTPDHVCDWQPSGGRP